VEPRPNGITDFHDEAIITMDCDYEFVSNAAALRDAVNVLAQSSTLAVDTETGGLDPFHDELLMLQVATPDRVFVMDCRAVDINPLRPLLEDAKTLKVLQNGKFDYRFLKHHYGISPKNIFDVMLAERLLSRLSESVSLEAIAKRYLGLTLDKSVRSSFGDSKTMTAKQIQYAAEDAAVLFPIYELQKKRLEREDSMHVAQLEFDALIPIAGMELAGLKIDLNRWKSLIEEHELKRDQTARELRKMLRPASQQLSFFDDVSSLDLDSPKQLAAALAQAGLHLADTSAATLRQVSHPVVQKILEYRVEQKIVAAFGESLLAEIEPTTGRIHPDFQQLGAETGRLSCRNPNVQQIPAHLRECFVARPGYKIVQVDYSQCESRILAELSQDPAFCEAFRSGGDLHAITASRMFRVPLDQVSADQRHQAKVINFGLAYGEGPAALAAQLGISPHRAGSLIDEYFKSYPGVQRWLQKAAQDALDKGYSVTPLGRKRFFQIPDRSDPDFEKKVAAIRRQGKNSPIQGANADMIKLALVELHRQLQSYDARIINCVHDEIVVEASEGQAEAVREVVEQAMVKAGECFIKFVPVKVEGKIGDRWRK
jgi:DNA polymerase-1